MAEHLISERVVFSKKSEQEAFLRKCKKHLDMSWADISKFLGVSPKTVYDWSRGKFKMSYLAVQLLSERSEILLPLGTKVVSWKEHLKSIAHLGGLSVVNKCQKVGGDELYRKKKWKEWWEREGKSSVKLHAKTLFVRLPLRDEYLAEFVGIMMGDGGVAPYHISITLNSETDAQYKEYVSGLIKRLFELEPKVYKRRDCKAVVIIIQRKVVVDFCSSIGLPKGNKLKQGLIVPQWIQEDKNKMIACMRGLFDTDGSVFKHSYFSKGKNYSYLNISLSSRSLVLLETIKKSLINLQINARIARGQSDLRIEDQNSVSRFVTLIGTHNPKHQDKIDLWRSARAVNRTGC